MHLPVVFISGIKLNCMKGKVNIRGKIRTGMVVIGGNTNPLYMQVPNKCSWTNYGGECVFSDRTFISGGSAIEIGQYGTLFFDSNVYMGVLTRIACYENIYIGTDCTFSWENILVDTDFHSIESLQDHSHSKMTRPISIGKNNWFGIRCCVTKGAKTPDNCIISAYSFLNKNNDFPENSLVGGIPAKLLKTGLKFDRHTHVNPLQL